MVSWLLDRLDLVSLWLLAIGWLGIHVEWIWHI